MTANQFHFVASGSFSAEAIDGYFVPLLQPCTASTNLPCGKLAAGGHDRHVDRTTGDFGKAETTLPRYFAHESVVDNQGVIAPWYQGLNGQCDWRVRIAAETMKRYPWVGNKSPFDLPEYMVNNHWSITEDGKITVLPPIRPPVRPWPMDMDYGYRFYFVVMGWVDYYRYTGDPTAIAHVWMQVNHMLDYTLTGGDYRPWPSFPISVPFEGDPYGHAKPNWIQLDLSAHEGLATLKAYQMVGEQRWFEMAKHWGDLFAANCNFDPTARPWNRYATVLPPEDDNVFGVPQRPGNVNRMTGGVSIVVEFLDELIRLGYRGKDDQIVKARNRGLQYLRDTLLPAWTQADTWGVFSGTARGSGST